MTETTNTSLFAAHYLQATVRLLDAIGTPSAEAFDEAHKLAILAVDAAYAPLGDVGFSVEWPVGQELVRTIEVAARRSGYFGLKESTTPTKGTS